MRMGRCGLEHGDINPVTESCCIFLATEPGLQELLAGNRTFEHGDWGEGWASGGVSEFEAYRVPALPRPNQPYEHAPCHWKWHSISMDGFLAVSLPDQLAQRLIHKAKGHVHSRGTSGAKVTIFIRSTYSDPHPMHVSRATAMHRPSQAPRSPKIPEPKNQHTPNQEKEQPPSPKTRRSVQEKPTQPTPHLTPQSAPVPPSQPKSSPKRV